MNAPLIHRPVALVGLPGAGKTTVGALLAEQLGLPFFDSDAEIERKTSETIPHLFAAHGEAHFRTLERQTIDRLLDGTPLVLATGGGAMAEAGTRQILLGRVITIWLDAPAHILASRLEQQSHRPLLSGSLSARLEMLQAGREVSYRAATHHVDAAPPAHIVIATILTALAA